MENATKALLIAAGIFFVVAILTMGAITYNQISNYYKEESDTTDLKQIEEFNKKYRNYLDREVRGTELLSIINLVNDYNARLANTSQGYSKLELNIYVNDKVFEEVRYITSGDYGISNNIYLIQSDSSNKIAKDKLLGFSNLNESLIQELKSSVSGLASSYITDNTLEALASKISNIFDNDNSTVKSALADIFYKITIDNQNDIRTIRKIACRYYELVHFKRIYFKCTDIQYDNSTGRINKMEFYPVMTTSGNLKIN